ncbi:hypothetical protein [Streptomyces sp. NPDC048496]|uniref:hypothetical protein n=1 Tax=Streptomyces sp. NPDC048496 TaxID=3365558 RepID=UPI00372034D3
MADRRTRPAAVPAVSEDAAGHLVARWCVQVGTTGAEVLEKEGALMFGEWRDAAGAAGADREAARERAERGQRPARREALTYLD